MRAREQGQSTRHRLGSGLAVGWLLTCLPCTCMAPRTCQQYLYSCTNATSSPFVCVARPRCRRLPSSTSTRASFCHSGLSPSGPCPTARATSVSSEQLSSSTAVRARTKHARAAMKALQRVESSARVTRRARARRAARAAPTRRAGTRALSADALCAAAEQPGGLEGVSFNDAMAAVDEVYDFTPTRYISGKGTGAEARAHLAAGVLRREVGVREMVGLSWASLCAADARARAHTHRPRTRRAPTAAHASRTPLPRSAASARPPRSPCFASTTSRSRATRRATRTPTFGRSWSTAGLASSSTARRCRRSRR